MTKLEGNYSFTHFYIIVASKEDETDSFPLPATFQPIRPTIADTTEAPVRRFKIETEPNFTAKLRDKTIPVGKSMTFTCTVTGIPNPKITWYRDGRDVTKESRYIVRVGVFSVFFIKSV